MKSGITTVASSLLCVVCAMQGGETSSRIEVPRGFTAHMYARGIPGARDLRVMPDGRITLQGRTHRDRFEILPASADEPVTVMRVATELDVPHAADEAAVAVGSPHFVHLRWDAMSGQIAYALAPAVGARIIPVAPQPLALARSLEHQGHRDVALAPDGALFLADSRAGTVWRIRRAMP